jgi:hypothetical protein
MLDRLFSNRRALVALGVLVFAFVVLKAYALRPMANDEGIYFYLAGRTLEGAVPYRDFFFAHPPLHLLGLALLRVVTGGNIDAVKLSLFTIAAAQAVVAYLIVARVASSTSPSLRRAGGLVCAAALLFGYTFLTTTSGDTGVVQASTLAALSALALAYSRPALSGCLAAAAAATTFIIVPLVMCIAVWAVALRCGRRFLPALGIGLAACFVPFLLLSPGELVESLLVYNLQKATSASPQLAVNFVIDNAGLLLAAVLAILVQREKELPRFPLACLAAAVVCSLAPSLFLRTFSYYYQPALLPLTVSLGCAFALLLSERREGVSTPIMKRLAGGGIVLAIAVLPFVPAPISRAAAGSVIRATPVWSDAPGIGALNSAIRWIFWRDEKAEFERGGLAITRYLLHQSRWLDVFPDMSSKVQKMRRDGRIGALFGDASVVPGLAVASGLPVAGDLADTNAARLAAGSLTHGRIAASLRASSRPGIVLAMRPGLMDLLRSDLQANFRMEGEYRTRYGTVYRLYAPRDGMGP